MIGIATVAVVNGPHVASLPGTFEIMVFVLNPLLTVDASNLYQVDT
jgi:hypothetical protein